MLGFFHCRVSCGLVFSIKATRNSHESKAHPNVTLEAQDLQGEANGGAAKDDSPFNYHQAKLAFGLILFEFGDTSKEGYGERLPDLFEVALLLYKAHGKTKYAKIEAILSETDAHDPKWNRTFNKHGLPGMNIPLDLRTKQFNHDVKSMWKSLAANLNEDLAALIANTVEPMEVGSLLI